MSDRSEIFKRLQDCENEQSDGYQLKSNEQLIDIISEFGNGETEFHTVDIDRLIVENEQLQQENEKRLNQFVELEEKYKNDHGKISELTANLRDLIHESKMVVSANKIQQHTIKNLEQENERLKSNSLDFAEWINIYGIRDGQHEWKYKGDNFTKKYSTKEMFDEWKTQS